MLDLRADAVAFFRIEHQTVVAFVICHAAIKLQRVLARPFQAPTIADCNRSCIRHMRMQDAGGIGLSTMNAPMDEERCGFDRVLALDQMASGINHHQIAGCEFRPMQSVRVD